MFWTPIFLMLESKEELSCRKLEKKVHVKALPQVGRWKLLSDPKINRTRYFVSFFFFFSFSPLNVSFQICHPVFVTKFWYICRVGSCFPPISVACYDRYSNQIPLSCDTEVKIKISSEIAGFNAQLIGIKQSLSPDYLRLRVKV